MTTTTDPEGPGLPLQSVLARFSHGGRQYFTSDSVTSSLERREDGGLDLDIELIRPDPELMEFVSGGSVLVDDAGAPVGWMPGKPGPEAVEVDLWSLRVAQGVVTGFYRWVCTCEHLRFGGTTLEGENLGRFHLVGTVQPDSFGWHLEAHLPEHPLVSGFASQE